MKRMVKQRKASPAIRMTATVVLMMLTILFCDYKLKECACESDKVELIASARGISLNLPRTYGQATRPQAQQHCCGCTDVGRTSYCCGGKHQQVISEEICNLLRCNGSWVNTYCSQPQTQRSQYKNTCQAEQVNCENQAAVSIGWSAHCKNGFISQEVEVRTRSVETSEINATNKRSLISCNFIHDCISFVLNREGHDTDVTLAKSRADPEGSAPFANKQREANHDELRGGHVSDDHHEQRNASNDNPLSQLDAGKSWKNVSLPASGSDVRCGSKRISQNGHSSWSTISAA